MNLDRISRAVSRGFFWKEFAYTPIGLSAVGGDKVQLGSRCPTENSRRHSCKRAF